MAMSKAQRQKATNEMISIINSRAEAARRFREEETLRRPAIEKQEVQERDIYIILNNCNVFYSF